jgi:hypothetical protein
MKNQIKKAKDHGKLNCTENDETKSPHLQVPSSSYYAPNPLSLSLSLSLISSHLISSRILAAMAVASTHT